MEYIKFDLLAEVERTKSALLFKSKELEEQRKKREESDKYKKAAETLGFNIADLFKSIRIKIDRSLNAGMLEEQECFKILCYIKEIIENIDNINDLGQNIEMNNMCKQLIESVK